jgi:hypothetical protein
MDGYWIRLMGSGCELASTFVAGPKSNLREDLIEWLERENMVLTEGDSIEIQTGWSEE